MSSSDAFEPPTTVVRHPLTMRMLDVVAVEHPTPRVVRVTLAGQDMEGFRSDGPADHVKLFFPKPGESAAEVPELGPQGIVAPEGSPRPKGRDYTPKHELLDEAKLVIDVVLHEAGVGSDWAQRAQVGHRIGVAGPRGSHVLHGHLDGLVLVGDETALPAIQNFVRGAHRTQAIVVLVEIAGDDDMQPFPDAENVDVHWVNRVGSAGDPSAVLAVLRHVGLPRGRVFHWVAGETGAVRAIRNCLVGELGVDARMVEARGYWKVGQDDFQEPHED